MGRIQKKSQSQNKNKHNWTEVIEAANTVLIKKVLSDLFDRWQTAAQESRSLNDDSVERFIQFSVPPEQQFDLVQVLKKIPVSFPHKIFVEQKQFGQSYSVKLILSQLEDQWLLKASLLPPEGELTLDQKALLQVQQELSSEKSKLQDVLTAIQQLSSILEKDQLYHFLVQKICEILKAKRCSVMLLDEDTQTLSIKSAHGISDEIIQNTKVKVGEMVVGRVLQEEQSLWIKDIEKDNRCPFEPRDYYDSKSFFSIPLRLEDKAIGVVNVTEKDGVEKKFSVMEFEILRMLTRQTGIALDNANYCNRLKQLSITDPLTGLFNKRHFMERLDREIARARRYENRLSLIMIDLDGFKNFNDSRGHLAGDMLLKIFGKKLMQSFRDSDVICRFGGDEFGVILPETGLEHAKIAAQKINKASQGLGSATVTVSLGVAEFQKEFNRAEFIEKADAALYEAKKNGKDQIAVNS